MKRVMRPQKVIFIAALLTLIVALSAVLVIMATPSATFGGIQVATDGNINLRFYYTITDDSVTSAQAVISDDNVDPHSITVPLVTAKDGKTYFNVPLAAAEMGCDVTVTPVNGSGVAACAPVTYSVRDYAELVLDTDAEADYSSYYSAIKSILNYGAYAHKQFDDQISNNVVENEGVFSRGTNPVINMGYELGTGVKVTPEIKNADVTNARYELVLDSYTQIRLYYTYTGTGKTDGIRVGNTNEYYVKVGNISTADYATTYELVAKVDGADAVSVSTSVLDCLKVLAASDDTRDIAHAMYYYYLNTAGTNNVPSRTDCAHHRQHYEATTLGANTSVATCSYCGKVMSGAVSDSVNYYSAPGQQVNLKGTDGETLAGTPVGTVMTEGDLTFTRLTITDGDGFEFRNGSNVVQTMTVPAEGARQYIKDANGNVIADSILGGSGKYVVLKYRYTLAAGTDNQGLVNLTMFADSAGYADRGISSLSLKRYSGSGYKSYMSSDTWEIYVIDIEQLASGFYGANQANVNAASFGLTFAYLGSGANARTVNLDIAYFAICDSFEEIDAIVSESTVSAVDWKNETNAYSTLTATGKCESTHAYVPSISGGKYSHVCKNPSCKNTYAFDADINYFSAPGQMYNSWNAAGKGSSCAVAGTVLTENGVTYQHIPMGNAAYFEFTNGTITPKRGLSINGFHNDHNQVDAGDTLNGGTGNYFVLKVRGNAMSNLHWYLNSTDDGGNQTNTWGNYVTKTDNRTVSSELSATDWTIYVVDISGFGTTQYVANDSTATKVAVGLGMPGGGSSGEYLDIAYFAICDGWDEIAAVVGKEKVTFVETWVGGSAATLNPDGTCDECAIAVSKDGDKYTYACTVCKTVYDELTYDSSINYITAPGQFAHKNAYATSLDTKIKNDNGVLYQTFSITARGGTMPLTTGGHVKPNQGYFVSLNGGTGNYLVFKMRTNNVTALAWRLSSASDSVAEVEPSGNYLGLRTDLQNGEWVTYVVNIKDLLTLTGINTTYGEAGDTTRTKLAAGFMYGPGSGDINTTNVSVDISYFAVCDSWEEVEKVVGEGETVSYTAWANNAALFEKNSDGSCVLCSPEFTSAADGTVTYTCKDCKKVYTNTVDDSVNYYSAPGQFYNNWAAGYGGNTKCEPVGTLMQDEEGFIYSSIRMGTGASFEFTNGSITPVRGFSVNGKRSDNDPIDLGDTIKGGTGKYFVIKVRTHDIDELRFLANGDNDNEGVASYTTGDSRPTAAISDEWVVYVVDIEKLGLANYAANQTAVSNVCVGMLIDQSGEKCSGNERLDIAYFAICDNWDEVATVVGDDNVIYTDWKSNTFDKNLNSEGVIDTVGDNAEKVIYQKTGEHMYIYVRSNVPGVDKYTRYEFKRIVDNTTKFDSWKISMIDICDSDLNLLYTTVQGACELEAAIQEKLNYGQGTAAADFIGGWHGDEYMTSIKILVDGVELDMSKDYALKGCDSVQAVVESYLNRCSANTTTDEKVFDRVKTDTWTKDGLVIHNKFTATDDIFIQRAATSMLAIKFGTGIITEHRNTNLAWTTIPDFQAQNASGITFDTSNVTWAEFRGKINVRVEMSDYKINDRVPTTGWGSFSYDYFGADARRVKIYIEPFYMEQLYAGDVFECTSTQSIFAAE
ncbi:MAG: hypothetical protein E7649_02475 [Ruminococcaceae bacterium]|nr:hypothetical protein [Oscillospiraceae bacterium]